MADVHAITSPFYDSPTWVHERTCWVERHFGLGHDDITHTRAKGGVYGDILLDDKPQNVAVWKASHPGGLALQWHLPNTAGLPDAGLRVHTWEEVLRLVTDFARTPNRCTRCNSTHDTGGK